MNSVTSCVGLVNSDAYHPPICMPIEKDKGLDNNTV